MKSDRYFSIVLDVVALILSAGVLLIDVYKMLKKENEE